MKLRGSTLGARRRGRRSRGGLARRREIFLVQSTRERVQPGVLARGASWLRRAGLWLIAAGEAPLKRAIDVVVAAIALVALSPLLAVVALLIRRDGGTALFWQERVGQHGRSFLCPKFRSMVADADAKKDTLLTQSHHGESITFKMKNDPRVTPIGFFIRRTSIDELPQLWTVLTGAMSLVGPRPPVPREVAAYTLADRQRLDIKPGLTCIWQVSGRGDIPFERQIELDMEYIRRRSLRLDFQLLFRTVPAVLSGRGAY
jgi:lipopolysaccharide/colanic/teichoic acid biosynthesis glycosyltransferase